MFSVLSPDGIRIKGLWKSIAEIPAKLEDRFERSFDTEDATVVMVYGEHNAALGILKEVRKVIQ